MRNLYYVACYSHHHNDWMRFLVTAEDKDKASAECESHPWEVRRVAYVCTTADEVNKEV